MKKGIVVIIFSILVMAGFSFAESEKQIMGEHSMMMGQGQSPDETFPCPMHSGMRPGMMSGPGMGGCGMMGHGMGGCGMMGHGMGGCGMMGHGMGFDRWSCGAEEQQRFLDETRDLRKSIHAKMFDYSEAVRIQDTKPETIEKLEDEIFDLKRQVFRTKRMICQTR